MWIFYILIRSPYSITIPVNQIARVFQFLTFQIFKTDEAAYVSILASQILLVRHLRSEVPHTSTAALELGKFLSGPTILLYAWWFQL